jgi:glucosamine-6-phosphate deaminase
MTDIATPQVHVYRDERATARALARHISAAIRRKPDLVLGLPTGRTPIAFYKELCALVARGRLDLGRVTTFNLDEFLGLPPSHPGSYRRFMETHLFSPVNLPAERTNFLNGSAPDPDAECQRYEQAIVEAGGIDLQILGIGTNGHIGFNEPAPALQARTHRVTLRPETRRSNAALFEGESQAVPREALSMGMATILQARALVLLATGRAKASCVERMLHGPITTDLPASFLQLHPEVHIVVDEAAAGTWQSAQSGERGPEGEG